MTDLHLDEVLGPFLDEGDVLGHEPMGVVEEVGHEVTELRPGDRVVVPFNVSCGTCWMCGQGLHSQCETTRVREYRTGASLFGYTKLYGQVPGGQAAYLRVPFGNTLPVKVPDGPADDRFVYLSDILPTAWQAVNHAGVGRIGGGRVTGVAVLGLGPIGDMATRVARHLGVENVIGIDRVPERLARAPGRGVTTVDLDGYGTQLGDVVRGLTAGRGADAVIDAVGMEAHGSPVGALAHRITGLLPDTVAAKVMTTAGTDRLAALYAAIDIVRRGGTISVAGVYGAWPTRCRCSRCPTSRSSCAWARRTCTAGCPRSCRCSSTTTRWASRGSRPTGCRWTGHRWPTPTSRPSAAGP